MKSIRPILAIACIVLLISMLSAAQATEAATETVARFSMDDMTVDQVQVLSSREDSRASFGDPDTTESYTSEATGDQYEIWYYEGLTLTFTDEDMLIGAQVTSSLFAGSRGVQVGQTADDVAGLFYAEPNPAFDTVLYSAGYVEALDAQLPPCGVTYLYDDGTFTLQYAAPSVPFNEAVLSSPMDFVYEELASFTVTFDQAAVATGYSWYLGPWAE